MADSKHSETRLTRSEAVEVITIACTSRARAAVVIDELAGAGVRFAPEPVAEPNDHTLFMDDGGTIWAKHADGLWHEYVLQPESGRAWADISHPFPSLYGALVDTPEPAPTEDSETIAILSDDDAMAAIAEAEAEPAPKYTAYRDKHGDIRVNGFPYPDDRRVLRGQIARRQAVLDLLNREAGK